MDVEKGAIMDISNVERAIAWQADHATNNSAPITGRIVAALRVLLGSETRCGARMANWPGLSLEDAMPLRMAGGLHNLLLTGADDRLAPVYAGQITDQAVVDAIVLAVVRDHDARLEPWLDGPPQTNEAGRSGGIMAGLLWLAERLGPRFELNELGASAGINTMMDRFAFDLGGVTVGPQDSPMRIAPEWRGSPPPAGPVEITAIEGCDVAPIDLTDAAAALRLRSYVWAENATRLARIDAAVALAQQCKPRVTQCDAGDFVAARLAAPQAAGVTRVFYHSIVWQYIPAATRQRIEGLIEQAGMEQAGGAATPERPLAWVMVETNRQTFRHEIRVRFWTGGAQAAEWALLGQAHAHGAWVEWF